MAGRTAIAETQAKGGPTSLFVTAPDGLKLHVRAYGSRSAAALPVVCLPGLTRNAADFHALATALADDGKSPRRVYAMDYRGRGRSDYDSRERYTLAVELADLLSVLTALEASPAIFIGTSRGGILAMLLAARHPAALAGVVLNDVGPVLEPKGLMRIKGYVGKLPQPRSFEDGADILRRLSSSHFTNFDRSDWLRLAKRQWREKDGRLVPDYDVRIAKTLESVGPDKPLPDLWPQFHALTGVPLMVIRGMNSDILSAETLSAMRAARPDLDSIEVLDQGHVPDLDDPALIRRIDAFAARCDAGQAA